MATYVIGDLHGCYDAWMELQDKIESKDKQAKYILLGDIEDRGPDGYKLIKWARKNITDDGKYQMVMGNHEKIKIDWRDENIKDLEYYGDEITHEGVLTVYKEQYDIVSQYQKQTGREDIYDELWDDIKWMETLPYYKEITVAGRRCIITHASLPDSVINEDGTLKTELTPRQKDSIVWDRDFNVEFTSIPNAILVNGHTPTFIIDGCDGHIYKVKNRYTIDCGAVFRITKGYKNANLAALRLDDLKEIYLWE